MRDLSIIAIAHILPDKPACLDAPPRVLPAASMPASPCADESVGYLLSRVRSLMTSEVQAATLPRFQLNSTQASMLMLLRRGPHSGVDLAREVGLDASAVTRLLDKLEHRALVARTRSASDRRVVHVELSAAGRAMLEGLQPIYVDMLERILAGFTPDEADTLKYLLKKIILNHQTCTGK